MGSVRRGAASKGRPRQTRSLLDEGPPLPSSILLSALTPVIPSTASYPLLHHPLPYSYPPPPTACPPPHPPLLPGEPDESRRRTLPLLTWQGLAKAFNMWWAETEKWHRMHTIAASFAHRPKRKALNAWCAVARPREAPTVFTHCFTRRKPLALAGSNARSRTRSESGFSPRRLPRCARSARPFSSLHAVPRTGG